MLYKFYVVNFFISNSLSYKDRVLYRKIQNKISILRIFHLAGVLNAIRLQAVAPR